MGKSIAIIGLSRFGLSLVEKFSKLNVEVVALDLDKEGVRKASEFIQNAFVADSTNEDALKECGVSNVDHVIVAIGQNDPANLSSSILTIIKLKELGIKEITARADDDAFAKVFISVGATSVVSPLGIASERIASRISARNVIDYFNVKDQYDIYEIKIAPQFKALPITQLDARNKYKINILLIERANKVFVPTSQTVLTAGDEVFIFGNKKDIPQIIGVFSR